MRRIRHLASCDYVVKIGQRINQLLTLSNYSNVVLERTWHKLGRGVFDINLHAKFNTDLMNGIHVVVQLEKDGSVQSSQIPSVNLYRVSESDWTETLVGNFLLTEISNGVYSVYIDQSDFGSNELSGLEVYSIQVEAQRKRKKFNKKVWFNHLGCFDSILRLKQQSEYLNITKLDE